MSSVHHPFIRKPAKWNLMLAVAIVLSHRFGLRRLMAEERDQGDAQAQGNHPPPQTSPPPPPSLEVTCKSLGKASRFAAGTKAGFAVSLINRKLGAGAPLVLHIEAVKDGEEPVSFGHDAVLVDYGKGWKLKTVTELDYADYGGFIREELVQTISARKPNATSYNGARPVRRVPKPGISFLYFAKILFAFVLLFVLGAIFTLALESLPQLILFMNSLFM